MTITVDVADALLENLGTSSEELNREIRLAAAIHLYSRGLVTQGKGRRDRGAEPPGLHRGTRPCRGSRVPGHFRRIDRGGRTCLRSASYRIKIMWYRAKGPVRIQMHSI